MLNRVMPDRSKMQFKINLIKDQASNSMNCGWHSIKFLLDRYDGKKFMEATKFIDNSKNGEKDIKAFQKHFKKFGYL